MKKIDYRLFNIKQPQIEVKPGVLLVAPPLSNDFYYGKIIVPVLCARGNWLFNPSFVAIAVPNM